jgi:hypothetical protein
VDGSGKSLEDTTCLTRPLCTLGARRLLCFFSFSTSTAAALLYQHPSSLIAQLKRKRAADVNKKAARPSNQYDKENQND